KQQCDAECVECATAAATGSAATFCDRDRRGTVANTRSEAVQLGRQVRHQAAGSNLKTSPALTRHGALLSDERRIARERARAGRAQQQRAGTRLDDGKVEQRMRLVLAAFDEI